MSMQFSDTSGRTGIVELIEDLTGTQSSTSSSYPLKSKTRDINNAFANFMMIAQKSSGTWIADDTNQVDYPIATLALVANQQDYSFTVDEQGNQVQDIYRVEALDSSGNAYELKPIDMSDVKNQAMTEFMDTAGTPIYYDKTANGVFLYPKPNYNSASGLKLYFDRTPSYFASTDTTKKPGIPDRFHEYLAIRASYFYCFPKGLPQTSNLASEMLKYEGDDSRGIVGSIQKYFSKRAKDEPTAIRTVYRSSR